MLSVSDMPNALPPPPADPPPVVTFHAANTITDLWDFDGTVTDHGHPVSGLKVQFGGVLAKYHLTATVETSGRYEISEQLRDLMAGTATAQTRDAAGKASNVAMTFIDSRNPTVSQVMPLSGVLAEAGIAGATITTVAGASRYLGDGGAAAEASLNSPQSVAVDGAGNLFIADAYNNVIREINAATGTISTVAGNGVCGYSGDGSTATSASSTTPRASRWTPRRPLHRRQRQ